MPANLENSTVVRRLEKVRFYSNPKEGQWKRTFKFLDNCAHIQISRQLCSFYMRVRLYSKSFKLGFSSTWTKNFQMYKLALENVEEPEIKLLTFFGSYRKQGNSRKTSTSASGLLESLWLCGSHQTVENSYRDGNTRPPYLSPDKPVCRWRSNS